ncbi:hypothetical protein IM40_04450 [Candidatus Paracaedimonas acanthamoebae]|nr:hypothetical protein IM40_04450 [Candidatus Paracaedimonas acanthamoebae]
MKGRSVLKPEWGAKRICRKCSAHFYDLQKDIFECPKCNTSYSQDDFQIKNLRTETGKGKKKVDKVTLEENLDMIDVGLGQEIDDGDLLEDADELSDENVSEVIDRDDEE